MPSSPDSQLCLFEMILIIAIPGAFGGFISSLFEREKDNTLIWKCISRSLIGIGGAFGVVLIGFWVGKISTEATVLNKIFLISFCLIGGTISFRLLPKIGTKLEEQLQLQIDETKRAVKNIDKKSDHVKDYSLAIASAETALTRKNEGDIDLAINRLSDIKEQFPMDRTLHIYLGRLFKVIKDYDRSIATLRDFIEELEKEHDKIGRNPHYHQDKADALFNIACYYVLKAEEMPVPPHSESERKLLINDALEEIKLSCDMFPKNREFAKKDDDFKFIRDMEEFKKITEIPIL